jgi:hypothetical protein
LDCGCKACLPHNLLRELKPSAIASIGDVDNSPSVLSAELYDRAGQINHISGTAPLVIHHIQRWATLRQFQDCIGKTFAADSKKPRRSDDAAIRHRFKQPNLRFGLARSVDALWISTIIRFIGICFRTVEYIIGTKK